MTTRYHLTADREKTIVPTDSTIWVPCPVEHPDAERFSICDDRCMVVATCYDRDTATDIVNLANKALDAMEADERIVGAISIATQQTHTTVADAVGSLLDQHEAVCGMLPDDVEVVA